MFRFANIEMLWLLIVVPVLIGAHIVVSLRKRKQIQALGDPELIAALMPNRSQVRTHVKFGMMMLALTLLILAAARPQSGQREQTIQHEGIEVMVALDISNSMLAEDVAPNRLEKAKQMLIKMIDEMDDDRFGLVVFAGESFTQLPITCDYVSAKMYLSMLKPDLIRSQGTAIGSAIETAISGFGEIDPKQQVGRAIILITDGENHEDDALQAAKHAHELGMRVFVIGIGKPEGAPIPIAGTKNFRKDREGNVVVSRLNEDMCRQIASAGQGLYVRCDNTNTAMRALQSELKRLKTAEHESTLYTAYDEQYQSFVLMALLLLIIEYFIFNRKNKKMMRLNLFGHGRGIAAAILLALSILPSVAQSEAPHIRQGNKNYDAQQYDEAILEYQRALERNSESLPAQYNMGNTFVRLGQDSAAMDQYIRALEGIDEQAEGNRREVASLYHNIGNILYAHQQYDKAVVAYRQALRKMPKDNETRYNLIKAQEKLKEQQQQQQNQQQNQNQQQQKQEQQKQQQQQEQEQQQQQQQQQDQNKMNKETAEQLLQALEQNERETQEKLQRQQGEKKRIEKDW